jgi:hypothetical protein
MISDPNFPLIRLPAEYETHRATCRGDLEKGQAFTPIDAEQGTGCIRHFWITSSALKDLTIELTYDESHEPHINMSLCRFFGVLFGKEPYRRRHVAV